MPPISYAAAISGFLLATLTLIQANGDALWLEPSSKWYGIDGNWSSVGLYVGEPSQQVDVIVSTSLSEIWVIESSGCGSSALCTAARGNVFNISQSSSWSSLGAWELGLNYLDQVANGDYAVDAVTVYNGLSQNLTSLAKQVVAAINDTDYYTGFFGLGITPGRFKTTVVQSPIAAMVERDAIIPSHSYGYTAGAYYGSAIGTPMSLVLGGYDQNRFVPHDTTFSLNSTTRQPEALIRGITATVSSADQAPTAWNSTSVSLATFDESVVALIDSSTPYLWLPSAVCDHFAQALDLTWNETFGLYLFANDKTYENLSNTDLSFTFSLSSSDNRDNFGDPLNVAGVVNITISANAFAQTLRYPFMNLFEYGDAATPYFPLRRADGGTQAIIGRSFLQEAYLKTNYELSSFSLHQALFPENPSTNTSIVTVTSSADSPYPDPGSGSTNQQGLHTPAIVGIVVAASLALLSAFFVFWCVRRRKRRQGGAMVEVNSLKETTSSMEPETPRTPVARMFSRFARRFPGRRNKGDAAHEMSGDSTHPLEAAGQERYELAVPQAPVELDATDAHSLNAFTDFATGDTGDLSPYEMARRKMEKQLQGPVPHYTPGPSPLDSPLAGDGFGYGLEKGYHDISPVPHYRPSNRSLRSDNTSLSPASTPTHENYSYSIPSPMTPHGEWPPFPSAMSYLPATNTPPTSTTLPRSLSSPGSAYVSSLPDTTEHPSMSRSASSSGTPMSTRAHLAPPKPSFQRTPIDPSKVVCLGPLPDNIRPPHPTSMARLITPNGQTFVLPTIPSAAESRRQSTTDTLGSNYTVEEEEHMRDEHDNDWGFGGLGLKIEEEESEPKSAHTTGTLDGAFDFIHIPEPPTPISGTPSTGRLESRIDLVHVPTPVDPTVVPTSATQRLHGFDLVHVPQPAERRYSWEEGGSR
ncbi:aspartic peptidase domain-containing protein [Truncatella angustata]|uniref:Aspartic peptidase domain-containing protein n=1 Tax=Truncatella angustata TaxID=152316 RepID=A0A9P9A2M2_9PEZI|nr:aspartic peptidase domain-containing protein [Truncatella angustata]KAH6659567.1 aspartic peptidase domain-containing protein [Truncatella angustata]